MAFLYAAKAKPLGLVGNSYGKIHLGSYVGLRLYEPTSGTIEIDGKDF